MSSIDINKLSCGGSGYIEQVIESVKKSILEGCIICLEICYWKRRKQRLDKLSCQYSLVE